MRHNTDERTRLTEGFKWNRPPPRIAFGPESPFTVLWHFGLGVVVVALFLWVLFTNW